MKKTKPPVINIPHKRVFKVYLIGFGIMFAINLAYKALVRPLFDCYSFEFVAETVSTMACQTLATSALTTAFLLLLYLAFKQRVIYCTKSEWLLHGGMFSMAAGALVLSEEAAYFDHLYYMREFFPSGLAALALRTLLLTPEQRQKVYDVRRKKPKEA